MENKNNTPNDSQVKLNKKIKESWSGLNDQDVALYRSKPEDFFTVLKEKQNISKEDAQKKLQQLEKDCGCSTASKAA
jgi:hypothetical protein